MSKIKQWSVSVLGNKPYRQVKDTDFYTSDTDANLAIELTDAGLNPDTATVTISNKDDGSVVSEPYPVENNKLTFPMYTEERDAIAHAGAWEVQIIYAFEGKDYTSAVMSFRVGGALLDKSEPRLEVIDSWTTLKKQAELMLRDYKQDISDMHGRIDAIITTPVDGVNAEEIIDARDGEDSLGAKIRSMDDERERVEDKSDRKHAQLDKELSSHKQATSGININQEATQEVEGRRVVSLPETTGEGHGNFGMQGLTATNLIENGGFRDGLDGWASSGIDENFNVTTGGGLVHSKTSARYAYYYNTESVNFSENDKLYINLLVKCEIEEPWVQFRGNNNRKTIIREGLPNGINNLSSVIKLESDDTQVGINIYSDSGEEGYEFSLGKIKVINLTQTFGTGNEPTKEECDKIFVNYFEGTQSVNGNVRVSTDQSTLYLNAPKLRSLPNGIADEIRPDGRGGYEVVRRVGSFNVNEVSYSDYWEDIFSYATLRIGKVSDYAYDVGQFNNMVFINNNLTIVGGGSTFTNSNPIHQRSTDDTIHVGVDVNYFVSMGYTKDNKGAKDYVTDYPSTLLYELAEPTINPLNTSGELITRPNGTVYIEDVIADVATYADKITVEQPIKELDQLSVVDYETGVEQELDVTDAVIAEGKLSFTHPELSNGDIVFFDCYLDIESTDGLATIEHYDSRYTIKDSVTGDFYKWKIGIADGEPSIKLEEL